MENKEKETSKIIDKKKLEITKKEFIEKEWRKFFKDLQNAIKEQTKYTPEQRRKAIHQEGHPMNWLWSLTHRWIKKMESLPFNLSDRIKNESKSLQLSQNEKLNFIDSLSSFGLMNQISEELQLSQNEKKELLKAIAEFFVEDRKFQEIGRKAEIEFPISSSLLMESTRKQKIYPRLEPIEKNLINLSLWYPSTKGLPKQNPEVKTWIINKGHSLSIEYDYQLSLPTVFTFEIAGILFGIWQDQGYSPTFFTNLSEICQRKGIPPSHKNRENVLIALRQLHNTRITAPFWETDGKGNKRKIRVWKINIVSIEAENITAGKQYTIELRINKYIAENIIQNYFTLFDYELLGKLRNPVAKRLYIIIKGFSIPYQKNLLALKGLLNLRDAHANQTIHKASQKLLTIGFLDHYKIEKSKRTKKLIYKAWRSKNQRVLKPQSKGTKTAIKGY